MKKLGLLLLFLCTNLYAGSEDALSSILNSFKNFQANFTQTVYSSKGKVTQQSFGHMALQRPGKFRWQVTKPMPQTIIANETRVYIYDPDLEQVTIKKLNVNDGEAPALLLSHDQAFLNRDYNVSEVKKNDDLQWFQLQPKHADSMFKVVEMGFANNQIKAMRLKDHLGNTTEVKYSDTKTNINLAASVFTFKPPRGVDVIDDTKKR